MKLEAMTTAQALLTGCALTVIPMSLERFAQVAAGTKKDAGLYVQFLAFALIVLYWAVTS
jgi:hypothetical protein